VGSAYTQRFVWRKIDAGASAGYGVYEVPAGYRAVIKSVAAGIGAVADGGAVLIVHGLTLIQFRPQVPFTSLFANMTMVAYERETIEVIVWGSYSACMVSGFIFTDETGPIGQPENPFEDLPRPQPRAAAPELDR
jgi:hypothetical protein